MVQYLVKSPRHLVQLVAGNLLTKGYLFYSTAWVPDGKDPLLVDAKLLLTYDAHLTKEQRYRRKKSGHASVRYLRCGRLCVLFATKGNSSFFERERWKDVRTSPLHLAGYAMKVTPAGKVSVRIHDEAFRKLKRDATARAGDDVREWERRIFELPFMAYKGVQDNAYHLVRHLNECRRLLRKPPVEWDRCIRRKISVEPVFLETPPEIEELLRWHEAQA
jgi:hypothetical protein